MTITLYSLPNCGICNMVKTKLNQKGIQFEEKDFTLIAEEIKSDHAPALVIEQDGQKIILNSPNSIVSWIKQQE